MRRWSFEQCGGEAKAVFWTYGAWRGTNPTASICTERESKQTLLFLLDTHTGVFFRSVAQ